mgnify:CR=1 FL=1
MRFAILSPIYPYRGGIAQFSGMLYTELVKEGHEVKAFNFKRLYPDISGSFLSWRKGKEEQACHMASIR